MPRRTRAKSKGPRRTTKRTTRKGKATKRSAGKRKAVRKKAAPKKAAKKGGRKPAKKAAKGTAKKTARKTGKKAAKKRSSKPAKRATNKSAKRATKKAARKATKTTAKRATKKTARKSARKKAAAPRASREPGADILHILNGDSTLALWQEADVPGRTMVHAEAWAVGPIAQDLDTVLPERLAWWNTQDGITAAQASRAGPFVAGLRDLAYGDDVALWGEADLFCFVNLLGAHSLVPAHAPALRLVWARQPLLPGDAAEVKALAEEPRPLGPTDRSVLRRAWEAYADPDAETISKWVGDPRLESLLPGAARMLRLHLARFPAKKSGLGDDEAFLLQRVVDGDHSVAALLSALRADDTMAGYGLTDLDILRLLHGLSLGKKPLVKIQNGDDPKTFEARATREAKSVLAGKKNRVKLCGIDRWIGGTHVTKDNAKQTAAWRPG